MLYLLLGTLNRALPLRNDIFILCYHGIGDDSWAFSVSKKTFKKQMEHLKKKGYSFVSLSQIEDHIGGRKVITKPSVCINFDDGYKDVLEVKDFVKANGIKPTMFLLSDTNHANRFELQNKRKFLSKSEIKVLLREGWEIGSHTATHSNMHSLNKNEIENEVVMSKNTLETELGIEIKYLAYPKGRYTNEIIKKARKAGYKLGLSMDDGTIGTNTNTMTVPRIGVDRTHSFAEFSVLSYPLVSYARGVLKRIIL